MGCGVKKIGGMSGIKLSKYTESLSMEARTRYQEKLTAIRCDIDPYVEQYTLTRPIPAVKYEHIYEFLISGNTLSVSRDGPAAFKSLDAYRMVYSEGWLSTLTIKEWGSTVVVKGVVKPSQRSGVLYETWVAVKHDGVVLCGHCTCMAGLSEACNHIGAVLYKCMQEAPKEVSCTSLPNKWLQPTKTVSPVPMKFVDFRLSKVEKCKSIIEPPKPNKTSSKAISKLNLRELTEDQQEDFYQKLSLLKHQPVVLAVHHKYNDPFKPKSTTKQLPLPISSFYDKNKVNLSLEELIVLGIAIKNSYKITDNDAMNLEELTRLQSKCHLWGIHRAGRITASNLKSVLCTSCDKPSLSLIKKLCYPEVYKFSNAAVSWGCQHESDAIQEFLDIFAIDHSDIGFRRSGLVVNTKYPFLGASPDGVVSCSCHGKMLIEVKCPYRCSCQHLTEIVEGDKNFCLHKDKGTLGLNHNHTYYYQVQCQLEL